MTQYMKEKSGADSRVEFQSGTTKKVIKPKLRPKSIRKSYTNQPIRKPAFTEGLELKKGVVTKRKGSGQGTLRIIDPTKDELTPAQKTMKKRPFRKKGGTTKEDLNPTTKKKPSFTFRSPSGQQYGRSGEYKVPRKTPRHLDKKKKLKT